MAGTGTKLTLGTTVLVGAGVLALWWLGRRSLVKKQVDQITDQLIAAQLIQEAASSAPEAPAPALPSA
jgi:hypothetical protein